MSVLRMMCDTVCVLSWISLVVTYSNATMLKSFTLLFSFAAPSFSFYFLFISLSCPNLKIFEITWYSIGYWRRAKCASVYSCTGITLFIHNNLTVGVDKKFTRIIIYRFDSWKTRVLPVPPDHKRCIVNHHFNHNQTKAQACSSYPYATPVPG